MFRLHAIRGPNKGADWIIPEGESVGGRDLANAICLSDLHASRRHFKVIREGDVVRVENMSQTNGTFVNGVAQPEIELNAGDRILVGQTLLEFRPPDAGRAGTSNIRLGDGGASMVGWMDDDEDQRQRDKINMTLHAKDVDFLQLGEQSKDSEKLDEAIERLRMIQDISNELVSEFDVEKLMTLLLDKIFDVISADRGYIFLTSEKSDELILQAAREKGDTGSGVFRAEVQISHTLVKKATDEKVGILVADTMDEFSQQESIIVSGMRSAMVVPLVFGDEVLGLVHVDSQSIMRAFGEEDLRLLTVIANQAAAAVRNARLRDQIVAEATTRAALSSYVPPQLIDRIVSGDIEAQGGGREVDISILFADIRGFTSLSERLTPTEVMDLLNSYCSRLAKIVFEHNGVIDKYIGDCIMAVFGSPEPEPQHATKAVECAVAMQEAVSGMTIKDEPLSIGVGVHTGACVQGNIGHEKMLQFTAVGDAVNTASRLCSVAGPGAIIISADTLAAAESAAFQVFPQPAVELKGKSQKLEIFSVERTVQIHGFPSEANLTIEAPMPPEEE